MRAENRSGPQGRRPSCTWQLRPRHKLAEYHGSIIISESGCRDPGHLTGRIYGLNRISHDDIGTSPHPHRLASRSAPINTAELRNPDGRGTLSQSAADGPAIRDIRIVDRIGSRNSKTDPVHAGADWASVRRQRHHRKPAEFQESAHTMIIDHRRASRL